MRPAVGSAPAGPAPANTKAGTDRLPAVVLVHGSGGVGFNSGMWAGELNKAGFATFVADSFTSRGITNTITDQSQLSSYTMMNDAFAALAVLAMHPRIDPGKIAVMGFSKGAVPALYASMSRFQGAVTCTPTNEIRARDQR